MIVLFFAELWERFSFYALRSLLNLYLTRVLGYRDERAYGVYGAYGALVYAFPVLGGLLADRWLGYRRAIVWGGLLMVAGHFSMAIPNETALYVALALLCLGNGFFKPNISSLLGELYRQHEGRRDAGFTIFYLGINIGAFFAPLICGNIGERVSWHLGFSIAGVGMLIGLIVFVRGQERFAESGMTRDAKWLSQPIGDSGLSRITGSQVLILSTVALIPLVALLIRFPAHLGTLLYLLGIGVYGGIIVRALNAADDERRRIFVALVLMLASTFFWALFEQAGSSLTLFADRHVDRHIVPNVLGLQKVFGKEVSASVFLAANPLFIMIFAIPFSVLWTRLARAGRNPSVPLKFSLGFIQLGLGYLVLVFGAHQAGPNGLSGAGWLTCMYFLHTTGELCLSPVGLSAITRLAPSSFTSTMMGAWFLATSYSHHFGAIIAKITAVTRTGPHTDAVSLAGFLDVFMPLGELALACGVLLTLISPLLGRATGRSRSRTS